jgi:hydrogenase maturation protein HypF
LKIRGSEKISLYITLKGVVQGVGFRPFVFRLANRFHLAGWVKNSPEGAEVEVEGARADLESFLEALQQEAPPGAVLRDLVSRWGEPKGFTDFEIKQSREEGAKEAWILPDLAACPECLKELFDPHDRRYRYPFLNCTHCGPRFSIIESLPYDRPHTTMKEFTLCPECRREYEDPSNRRFHAQPTACPECGPHASYCNKEGYSLGEKEEALQMAVKALKEGKILAVKGVGGYHLLCDARNDKAVQELRLRKKREEKPLALMAPGLEWVKKNCEVSPEEEKLLVSPQAPILLLKRAPDAETAPSVAPGNPTLGVMLPYAPLHHLLLKDLGFPVVATSGNLSDEPICVTEKEAFGRLGRIADYFLVHNRPIARPVDDSVCRILQDEPQVLRRARGYAPLPVETGLSGEPLLAFGAHLKNTVALFENSKVFLSQHIGDLDTPEALAHFNRVASDLPLLYDVDLSRVACDLHPDYASSQMAEKSGKVVQRVQHHVAHVFACAAENHVTGPFLGVAWDGAGLGEDGTIWGGEFFRVEKSQVKRVGRLFPFRLFGGDKAALEPRRSALGVLYEIMGITIFENEDLPSVAFFTSEEKKLLKSMAEKELNSPYTSSVGRLFDAVASLTGLCQVSRFEGQAAMKLEFALPPHCCRTAYPLDFQEGEKLWELDWRPMVEQILRDVSSETPVAVISTAFHNALVEGIVRAAHREGLEQVVMSGGCFQNKILSSKAIHRLGREGFTPFWHRLTPPNDGGIALGQAAYALWKG